MEIKELLRKGRDLIRHNSYANLQLEPVWVLSNLLNVDSTYIHLNLELEVSKEIEDEFLSIMEKRQEGYPLQYLLNEEEFMGLSFYLEEGVLIPRPETETMVEYIIDYINENFKGRKINILEIGVGSGVIALTIAKEFPNAEIIGIDIGDLPIKISNINKERFKLNNVEFIQGDLFQPLEVKSINKKFHLIISNPPYIKDYKIQELQKEVREFEPRLALDGGKDGLDFYRKISRKGKRFLKDSGMLIYEIGYDQGKEVKEILMEEDYTNISVLKDLEGKDRIVHGFKNQRGY